MENVSSVIESICKNHSALIELIKLDILHEIKNYTHERSGDIVKNPTTGVAFSLGKLPDNSWVFHFVDILPGITTPKLIDQSSLGAVISLVTCYFTGPDIGNRSLEFDLARDTEDRILLAMTIKDITDVSIYKTATTVVAFLKLYTNLYPDEVPTVIENIFEKENVHNVALTAHRNYKGYCDVIETCFKDNDLLNVPKNRVVEVRGSSGEYILTVGKTDDYYMVVIPDATNSYSNETNLTTLGLVISDRLSKEVGLDSYVGVALLAPFKLGGPKQIAFLFKDDPKMLESMGFAGTFLICHLGILEGKVPGLPKRDSEVIGPVNSSPFFEVPQSNFS